MPELVMHRNSNIKRGSYHDVAPSPFAQDDSLDG
jgi:hypothetical protein